MNTFGVIVIRDNRYIVKSRDRIGFDLATCQSAVECLVSSLCRIVEERRSISIEVIDDMLALS